MPSRAERSETNPLEALDDEREGSDARRGAPDLRWLRCDSWRLRRELAHLVSIGQSEGRARGMRGVPAISPGILDRRLTPISDLAPADVPTAFALAAPRLALLLWPFAVRMPFQPAWFRVRDAD